uniref:Arginine/serine-rich protein PNISR n=1 Tax=Panagrellus redivivus TaxID=6233 RepID=A0A7E4V4Q9_PANRE
MDPSGGNYFNQSYYENIPSNSVNWAMLARQWIQNGQPQQDYAPPPLAPHWGHPGPHHPPMPHMGSRYPMNAGPRQQLGPMFNHNYGHAPPPPPPPPPQYQNMPIRPRYDFFQAPSVHQPPSHMMHDRHPIPPPQRPPYHANPPPPGPLFPAAANAPLFPAAASKVSADPYEWPSEQPPPPPPPPPAWIKTDKIDGKDELHDDMVSLNSAERKKLPNWILEGLDQMEKAKRRREEVEKAKKEMDKKVQDVERKRSWADSSDEEEPAPVRRKFEEYRRISDDEKSKIKSQAVKDILIQLLLSVTDTVINKAAEDAVNLVRSKQSVKAVVNKNTAALASLADLGGSSSEEEDNDGETAKPPASVGKVNSGDKSDFVGEKARSESHESSSHSYKRRSKTRSRSPRSPSSDRNYRSSSSRHHYGDRRRSRDEDRHNSHNGYHDYHRSSHHNYHHRSRD